MGILFAVALVIYFRGSFAVKDLPDYDEAIYFGRGYLLTQGDFGSAMLNDPRTSPGVVVYYALWYLILKTPYVYPYVITSSLALLGVSAYVLFNRFFHPVLSWFLALFVVIATTPVSPSNALYYVGFAFLTLGLALLTKRLWTQALGLIIVLASTYIRPEFNAVFALLLAALVIYNIVQIRRRQVRLRAFLFAYVAVFVLSLFTLAIWMQPRAYESDRTVFAYAWSYLHYLERFHPERYGNLNFSYPFEVFELEFGAVPEPRTLTGMVGAMLRRPDLFAEYVIAGIQQLLEGLRVSLFDAPGWKFWTSGIDITPSPSKFQQIALVLGGFTFVSAAAIYLNSLKKPRLPVSFRQNVPALLGVLSMSPLVPGLILVNPHQRYYMIAPLVLLPIGYCLVAIYKAFRIPPFVPALLVGGALLVMPQPFNWESPQPFVRYLDILRANLPKESTLFGQGSVTFKFYLVAEGFEITHLDPADFSDPVLVNAYRRAPNLRYLLDTEDLNDDKLDRMFAEWNAEYPELDWQLVADDEVSGGRLYVLTEAGTPLPSAEATAEPMPIVDPLAAVIPDPSSVEPLSLSWAKGNTGEPTGPADVHQWGTTLSGFFVHPYYPDIDPLIATSLRVSLPVELSGRALVFLATIAEDAPPDDPALDGVDVSFRLVDTDTVLLRTVVDNLDTQNWLPIVVPLPSYGQTMTLEIDFEPRTSPAYDGTFIVLLGATQEQP